MEKPKKFGGAYASDEKKSDQGAQEVVTMSDLKNIWGIQARAMCYLKKYLGILSNNLIYV